MQTYSAISVDDNDQLQNYRNIYRLMVKVGKKGGNQTVKLMPVTNSDILFNNIFKCMELTPISI